MRTKMLNLTRNGILKAVSNMKEQFLRNIYSYSAACVIVECMWIFKMRWQKQIFNVLIFSLKEIF